jgi:ribosomal protein S8
MNYHVADFMLRIKNAARARRHTVVMPYSNINKAIGKTLVKQGFLAEIKEQTVEGKRILTVELRYVSNKYYLNQPGNYDWQGSREKRGWRRTTVYDLVE